MDIKEATKSVEAAVPAWIKLLYYIGFIFLGIPLVFSFIGVYYPAFIFAQIIGICSLYFGIRSESNFYKLELIKLVSQHY